MTQNSTSTVTYPAISSEIILFLITLFLIRLYFVTCSLIFTSKHFYINIVPNRMCDDGECIVCFNATNDTLVPCDHRVCKRCATIWFQTQHTCPVCRGFIASIPGQCYEKGLIVLPIFRIVSHIGVTLRSTARGVRVVRMNKAKLAYECGLRIGDVITHINGIQVTEQSAAVTIIEYAKENMITLYLRIRKRHRLCKFLNVLKCLI